MPRRFSESVYNETFDCWEYLTVYSILSRELFEKAGREKGATQTVRLFIEKTYRETFGQEPPDGTHWVLLHNAIGYELQYRGFVQAGKERLLSQVFRNRREAALRLEPPTEIGMGQTHLTRFLMKPKDKMEQTGLFGDDERSSSTVEEEQDVSAEADLEEEMAAKRKAPARQERRGRPSTLDNDARVTVVKDEGFQAKYSDLIAYFKKSRPTVGKAIENAKQFKLSEGKMRRWIKRLVRNGYCKLRAA